MCMHSIQHPRIQETAEKMDSSKKQNLVSKIWSFILVILEYLTLQLKSFFPAPDSRKQPMYPQGLQALLPSDDNKSENVKNGKYIVHSYGIKFPLSSSSSSSSISSSIYISSSLPSPASSSSSSMPSPSSSLWPSALPSSSYENSLIRAMSLASPCKLCAPFMDELLGTDNGGCMSSDKEVKMIWSEIAEKRSQPSTRKSKEKHAAAPKEYPPPLPWLARTGNLASRMPWVFTRQYEDGRLILVEQKVERHEYFEAHRENGCLSLTLIPVDDSCCYDDDDDDNDDDDFDEVMVSEDDETLEDFIDQEMDVIGECSAPLSSIVQPNIAATVNTVA